MAILVRPRSSISPSLLPAGPPGQPAAPEAGAYQGTLQRVAGCAGSLAVGPAAGPPALSLAHTRTAGQVTILPTVGELPEKRSYPLSLGYTAPTLWSPDLTLKLSSALDISPTVFCRGPGRMDLLAPEWQGML